MKNVLPTLRNILLLPLRSTSASDNRFIYNFFFLFVCYLMLLVWGKKESCMNKFMTFHAFLSYSASLSGVHLWKWIFACLSIFPPSLLEQSGITVFLFRSFSLSSKIKQFYSFFFQIILSIHFFFISLLCTLVRALGCCGNGCCRCTTQHHFESVA